MTRRPAVLAALATLAVCVPAASGVDAPARPELPRANCARRFVDDANDARLDPNLPPTTGADITGVLLRLTDTELQVFLAINDIPAPNATPPAMPATDTAYAYYVTFKGFGKTFTFKQMYNNGLYDGTPAATLRTGFPNADTGSGVDNQLPGFTAKVYDDVNYVIFTAPRARVEQNIGTTLKDGDTFTDVFAKTVHYIGPRTSDNFDKTTMTGDKAVWAVDDDWCFGAVPGTLSDLVTPAVQYGDTVQLGAKLVDEKGAAAAAKAVEFSVNGGAPITGTTGDDGTVTVPYVASLPAGTYDVVARYRGDATVGKTKLAGTIVVSPEVAKFSALSVTKPTSTTRTVTATLRDDDGTVIAGTVEWYVNGKKVASTVTNSSGKAFLKTAKPGQSVQAKFAGVAGKYAAASSNTAKLA